MDKYRVLRIDEDIDYGCEERQPGRKLMAVVTLEDQFGRQIQLKQEDQMLYDRQINEKDWVFLDETKKLVKCE